MSFLRSVALSCLLAITGPVAYAADLAVIPAPAPPASGWSVTIGLGPEVISSFPGAKTLTVVPTGHFEYHKPNQPDAYYAPDDAFDISLLDLGWIKAGPAASFTGRRGLSGGNGNFFGLHNVGWTISGGAFLEVWPWQDHLRTRLELLQGINGNHGLVGNVGIDGVQRIGPMTFALGPRMALGNSKFMQNYFSVTPGEAALNGIVTPYKAYGGVTSVGVFGSVKYDFSRSWSATLFGGYNRFVNSAAESPIPNKIGSLNQFSAGVILAYSFNFGGF